jgi:hypothetical protein
MANGDGRDVPVQCGVYRIVEMHEVRRNSLGDFGKPVTG